MSDTIGRQKAVEELRKMAIALYGYDATSVISCAIYKLQNLPSAEPEISRIEQELHGKTPEEQYEFLYWLLLKFALKYTDSRLAVIEWLRGEQDE